MSYLTQEDYNSMMRHPWETVKPRRAELPQCPKCGERYCSNGVQLCIECATEAQLELRKSTTGAQLNSTKP